MLPVVFKFLSDTTGLRFNEVNRGLGDIDVSSQKAGQAVRNFASIVRSGQEPVTALADSFSYLTRAFGLGVAGTVAVVGVVEVIKSFVAESERLDRVAEKLNSTLKNFYDSAKATDLSSAVRQIKALKDAIKEAQDQASKGGGGVLGRLGTTIANMMGLSQYNIQAAQNAAQNAIAIAKADAQAAFDEKIKTREVEKQGKFAVKRLEVEREKKQIEKDLKEAGILDQNRAKLEAYEMQKLIDIEIEKIKEEGEVRQKQIDEERERTKRMNEMRIRDEERLNELRRQGTEELKRGADEIEKNKLASATPLIDRIVSAAENLGIRGIKPLVEKQRKETQKQLDKEILDRLGITSRDVSITGQLFPSATEKIRPLLNLEAQKKSQEDTRLFDSVYNIRQAVMDLKAVIEQRLGVPILRTAY